MSEIHYILIDELNNSHEVRLGAANGEITFMAYGNPQSISGLIGFDMEKAKCIYKDDIFTIYTYRNWVHTQRDKHTRFYNFDYVNKLDGIYMSFVNNKVTLTFKEFESIGKLISKYYHIYQLIKLECRELVKQCFELEEPKSEVPPGAATCAVSEVSIQTDSNNHASIADIVLPQKIVTSAVDIANINADVVQTSACVDPSVQYVDIGASTGKIDISGEDSVVPKSIHIYLPDDDMKKRAALANIIKSAYDNIYM